MPAVEAELPPALVVFAAADEPPAAGVVGVVVVLVEPAVAVEACPPLLAGGVVAVPLDPALPGVPVEAAGEPPLAAGVPPVVGVLETGLFEVLLSPPHPNSAALATKAVDAQSSCDFFMIFLR